MLGILPARDRPTRVSKGSLESAPTFVSSEGLPLSTRTATAISRADGRATGVPKTHRGRQAQEVRGGSLYKTDRFARNKYDSAVYKRELKRNGIQIFYAAEAIPDGPEGIILESLMEGLAEYYSAELAQKIKRGMHESALKCQSTGSGRPLGYRVDEQKHFQIDQSQPRPFKRFLSSILRANQMRPSVSS